VNPFAVDSSDLFIGNDRYFAGRMYLSQTGPYLVQQARTYIYIVTAIAKFDGNPCFFITDHSVIFLEKV